MNEATACNSAAPYRHISWRLSSLERLLPWQPKSCSNREKQLYKMQHFVSYTAVVMKPIFLTNILLIWRYQFRRCHHRIRDKSHFLIGTCWRPSKANIVAKDYRVLPAAGLHKVDRIKVYHVIKKKWKTYWYLSRKTVFWHPALQPTSSRGSNAAQQRAYKRAWRHSRW